MMKMPTHDFLTRLDLISTHRHLFKPVNKGKMTEAEMEQLRIFMVGSKKLWMSRKPNEQITSSRQFKDLKKRMQPLFTKLMQADI